MIHCPVLVSRSFSGIQLYGPGESGYGFGVLTFEAMGKPEVEVNRGSKGARYYRLSAIGWSFAVYPFQGRYLLLYYLAELSGASGSVECHLCRLPERPVLMNLPGLRWTGKALPLAGGRKYLEETGEGVGRRRPC
jgi:hypothetical protein